MWIINNSLAQNIHTLQVIKYTLESESMLAGSAGMVASTHLVSTAITPTGIPPSLQKQ